MKSRTTRTVLALAIVAGVLGYKFLKPDSDTQAAADKAKTPLAAAPGRTSALPARPAPNRPRNWRREEWVCCMCMSPWQSRG